VTKAQVIACVREGADTINAVKQRTKAGTGCGGCKLIFIDLINGVA
jgi:NAD(P)H-nitrite reductase large subunit